MNLHPSLPYIIMCIIIVIAMYFICTIHNNRELLEIAAKDARAHDAESGFIESKDYYGNNIKIIRSNNTKEDYISYTAISAGPDGTFDTDDDTKFAAIDVNWSKKVGRSIGVVGKEFLKGAVEGLSKESPHAKE